MFNINWKLSPESTSQDCLVGLIRIIGVGSEITEDSVYIDSWLVALIEAFGVKGTSTVDIKEESVPLRVSASDEAITLSFRNQQVVGARESFKATLALTVRDFLEATKIIPDGGYANPLRPILADFVGRK